MKKLSLTLAHSLFLVAGLAWYLISGKNTVRSHRALVYFFCNSGGRFNDWFSRLISLRSAPLNLTSKTGVLGDMSGAEGQSALRQLNEKGYVNFERALPADACERLMQFALRTPANIRPMDGEVHSGKVRAAIYEENMPEAVRYDYAVNDLLANLDVQTLLSDRSLLALAEMYLGARPRFDVLSMWWHTNFHSQPDSEAAQFYHFDLDRLKWIKVFIYLTDVGPHDGPHSFIEGSHGPEGIPRSLLSKGYVRLTDEEVLSHYGAQREIRFAAPKGTIIVEDTRGLHKGNAVSGNSRLILQLQLSNSLFGGAYPKARFPKEVSPELNLMTREAGDVYRAYL
ncbi:MAG: hypothetical protein CFE44_11015 [Burkholderiales bacterium PBB4]|nr:MAG: hypothetical protein CFE44_11015 [Burkholderiales bacterium PBB4]